MLCVGRQEEPVASVVAAEKMIEVVCSHSLVLFRSSALIEGDSLRSSDIKLQSPNPTKEHRHPKKPSCLADSSSQAYPGPARCRRLLCTAPAAGRTHSRMALGKAYHMTLKKTWQQNSCQQCQAGSKTVHWTPKIQKPKNDADLEVHATSLSVWSCSSGLLTQLLLPQQLVQHRYGPLHARTTCGPTSLARRSSMQLCGVWWTCNCCCNGRVQHTLSSSIRVKVAAAGCCCCVAQACSCHIMRCIGRYGWRRHSRLMLLVACLLLLLLCALLLLELLLALDVPKHPSEGCKVFGKSNAPLRGQAGQAGSSVGGMSKHVHT